MAQIEAYLGSAVATNRQPAKLALAHGALRGDWRRLGHWPGYTRARAIVSHRDKLYVGVDGGSEGRAAVHAFNGEWRLAGGLGTGWSHGAEVNTLCVHEGLIHAGISSIENGAQLWRSDGQAWEQIGHWPEYFSVASLASYNGRLFAGLVSADKRDTTSPIVAYDGQWVQVSKSLGGYQCAYDLHVHNGALYAAMLSVGWPGGHVWRIAPERELIGGTGTHESWTSLSAALRLRSVGKHLVVVLNREPPRARSILQRLGVRWRGMGATARFPRRLRPALQLQRTRPLSREADRWLRWRSGRPRPRACPRRERLAADGRQGRRQFMEPQSFSPAIHSADIPLSHRICLSALRAPG